MSPEVRQGFRKWGRRLGIATLVLVSLLAVAFLTIDRWILVVLDPGPFNPALTPPAPDYTLPSSWAALPTMDDGADVALKDLPASPQDTAPVSVFYVHPTTFLAPRWNGAVNDPAIVRATTRGGTLIQASAFNACCAVYAPRYRQANGRAFTLPDKQGEQAIAIAYADVSAAFDVFLERSGNRPFFLASHSQGTFLAARLLRERIAGKPLLAQLVAAYLIGGPIHADAVGGLPICASARETGCVVAYNARAPGFVPNELEFDASQPDPMAGRICVNPLTWKTDGAAAPASENRGAVFLDEDGAAVLPAFASAQCQGGTLVVTDMGELHRDFMSSLLLRSMPENYHPIEYQIFYVNLRLNASERANAFLHR